MTEIIKDAQKSENSAIENLVVENQAAARKSCRSILKIALFDELKTTTNAIEKITKQRVVML